MTNQAHNELITGFLKGLTGLGDHEPALVKIARELSVVTYERRDVIIAHGEASQDIFALVAGQASAFIYSSQGHEIWLSDFEEGDLFGEMATLLDGRRSSSVIALSDVTAIRMRPAEYIALLQLGGEFAVQTARILAQRIEQTSQRMIELSAFSAPGRVYAELLRMSVPVDEASEDVRVITPSPRVVDIAARVNTTRETASRTVNSLERKGYIVREDNSMLILAPGLMSKEVK